ARLSMAPESNGLRGKAAVVGVADAVSPSGALDRPSRQLEVEMVRDALDDAGLKRSDVDGLFVGTGSSVELAEYLGIEARYTDSNANGGSGFEGDGHDEPGAT